MPNCSKAPASSLGPCPDDFAKARPRKAKKVKSLESDDESGDDEPESEDHGDVESAETSSAHGNSDSNSDSSQDSSSATAQTAAQTVSSPTVRRTWGPAFAMAPTSSRGGQRLGTNCRASIQATRIPDYAPQLKPPSPEQAAQTERCDGSSSGQPWQTMPAARLNTERSGSWSC